MTSVTHVNDLHDVPRWWKSANEAGGDDDHCVTCGSNQRQPVVRTTRMLEEQSQEMSRDIRRSCRISKAGEMIDEMEISIKMEQGEDLQ